MLPKKYLQCFSSIFLFSSKEILLDINVINIYIIKKNRIFKAMKFMFCSFHIAKHYNFFIHHLQNVHNEKLFHIFHLISILQYMHSFTFVNSINNTTIVNTAYVQNNNIFQLSKRKRTFSSFVTTDFKKRRNRNKTPLKNETKLTGIFAFLVIKL